MPVALFLFIGVCDDGEVLMPWRACGSVSVIGGCDDGAGELLMPWCAALFLLYEDAMMGEVLMPWRACGSVSVI